MGGSNRNSVWLAVAVVVFLAGTAVAHDDPEDRPIDEDIEASTLLLTLSDMQSTGWRKAGDGEFDSDARGFQDGHNREFVKAESSYAYRTIQTESWVFNTTPNATRYYHDQKNRTEGDWSTEEKPWGDEAYYWETVSSNSRSYFRDDNVVWRVERNRQGHYTWDPTWNWVADTLLSKYSPPNVPPEARIELTTTGRAVAADGTASSDPDGSIGSYSWNWGDNQTGTGSSPSHTYGSDGTYTITLRVTDDRGGSDAASRNVTVENLPPTSRFDFEPGSPAVGEAVQFTGRSEDPDTDIAETVWAFGDGNSSMSASPTHVYESPGTYSVTLTVTDSAGAEDASTETVRVTVRDQGTANGAPAVGAPMVSLLLATVAVVLHGGRARRRSESGRDGRG